MRTAILVVGLALGCGGSPDEETPPEQPAPTQPQQQQAATAPAPGIWTDRTACSGLALTGFWVSNFGIPTPGFLGTAPAGCRPAAGKYTVQCSEGGDWVFPSDCPKTTGGKYLCDLSNGILSCVVTVDAAGGVTLTSPAPVYGMTVYARFQ